MKGTKQLTRSRYWGSLEAKEREEEEAKSSEILVREPSILEVVENRIYFYARVDKTTILKLNRELRSLNNEYISQSQRREDDHLTPIYLHISSYGGSIFSGLAGLDQIRRSVVPVYTIVDGCCASAATFLSVAGGRRFINSHSFMMIHQLSSFMWGKYTEFEDEMKNLDRLMAMIKGIYNEFTQVPQDKLDEILKHDLWFDAKTSLEYGLVDEII